MEFSSTRQIKIYWRCDDDSLKSLTAASEAALETKGFQEADKEIAKGLTRGGMITDIYQTDGDVLFFYGHWTITSEV